jgi:hypothetical protein
MRRLVNEWERMLKESCHGLINGTIQGPVRFHGRYVKRLGAAPDIEAQKTKPEAVCFEKGFLEGYSGEEGIEKAVEGLWNTGESRTGAFH